MILRPYQTRALDLLRERIRGGENRLVCIAPTGAGKTVIASEMIRSAVSQGNRVLFIAHRKELIDQTVDKLSKFGVAASVIMGRDSRRDDYLPVQVATIQTLSRRLDRLPPAALVIYDEVHHAAAASSTAVLDRYANHCVIGLTATPWRSDRFGLADWFHGSVIAATPAELIESGALVRYDAYAYDSPELHDVGTVAGEYNQQHLELACNTSVLVGSVVREYLAHARGRRAILFPVSIAHSQALVAEFLGAGIRAAHVDCKTPKDERQRILSGLATSEVTVVSSVGILTEGFDSPAAEVCILARPTKSLTLHLQMIGRVLRPSPDTGKTRALLHDHAGNLLRHGFPEDERDYSLTATPARTRELHSCPFCSVVFGRATREGLCPNCRELITEPARAADTPADRREQRHVDGARIDRDAILRARTAGVPPSTRQRTLERLTRIATERGYKAGWVAHRYRSTYGEWPPEQRSAA